MPPSLSGPEGLQLLRGPIPKWKIGASIGSGACATVHRLESMNQSGSSTDYAIKVAPLPTKKTRKQNSIPEVNASRLYYEHTVYQNHFQTLQGTFVPRLPPGKGPPTFGEVSGFRYLVMERMHSQLADVVPALLKVSKTTTVAFGPVATQLLKCVQAIHECRHVVVDVKPDNFMLAAPVVSSVFPKIRGPKQPRAASSEGELAERIRILDLALAQPWTSVSASHRPNQDTSGLTGTPLYASLNVHHGQTPSRRDDLEALAYVIAELLMQLSSGDTSVTLPWSDGQSDEDIGRLKESHVTDANSEFYKSLGSASVVRTFKMFLDQVRGYSYKQVPDYNVLHKILQKLDIPVATTKRASAAAKVSTGRATRAKQVKTKVVADTKQVDDTKVAAGTKRRSTRASTRAAIMEQQEESPLKSQRSNESYHSCDDEEFVDAQEDTVYYSAVSRLDDPMDWDPIMDEENVKPTVRKNQRPNTGLTISIEKGPHEGGYFHLIEGVSDAIVVGESPQATENGEATYAIPGDTSADDSHVRLELKISKKLVSVHMTDMKSSSGVFVGGDRIRNTGRVFTNQSFRIGETTFKVNPLAAPEAPPPEAVPMPSPTQNRAKPKEDAIIIMDDEDEEKEDVKVKPVAPRLGVRIEVTDGPHKGETYILDKSGKQAFTLGSRPTGNYGSPMCLNKDKGIASNHVRLELNATKKLTTVNVVDLKGGETRVRNILLKKGKTSRAFISDKIVIGNTVLAIKKL